MTSRKKKKQRSSQPSETAPSRRQRSVSVPLLLGTAIVLAVLATASYFWHRYQVERLAPELLEQARALEAEGNLREATQWIHQYLQIRPDDAEARIYLASTYDATATDVNRQLQAIELYRDALLTASAAERPELNRRLAARLLEVSLFQMQALDTEVEAVRAQVLSRLLAATRVATQVIEHDDQDPEGWRILAASLLARHQLQSLDELPAFVNSIGNAVQQAVQHNPADVALAIQWAYLVRNQVDLLDAAQQDLTELERAELADAAVDRAVANNTDEARTYLARASYRSTYRLDGVRDDLDRAQQLAPDSATVQLALAMDAQRRSTGAMAEGNVLQANQHREQAVQYLERAIELEPGDVRGYLLLGQLHRQQGQPDAAIAVLEQGLEQAGQQNLQLNALLPELLLDRPDGEQEATLWKRIAEHIDRYDEAVRRMRPLLTAIARRDLEQVGDLLRARLLVQQGAFQMAINVLEQLLVDAAAVERTRQIVAWRLREQAHRELGQREDAARAAEQLARLEPDQVLPLIIAARNWLAAERPAQAVNQLQRALAVQESPETRFLLAAASLDQQRPLPPDQQNWDLFHENLERLRAADASRPIPRRWRLALLQAGYEQAVESSPNGKLPPAAFEQLRQAELDYPDDVICLQSLAAFYAQNEAERDAQRVTTKLEVLQAQQQGEWAAAEEWEEQLQAHRNNPPAFWQYYRARRLLAQASGANDPRLDEASQLHTELTAEYPRAKSLGILNALLHDARGNVADAIAAYQSDLAAGARNTNVLERLILLLTQTGRFDEAEQTLADVGSQMPETSTLRGLRIMIQRSKGDLDEAVRLAEQDVVKHPDDSLARLRLGRLYDEKGREAEAETAYREAIILDPEDIRGMSALFDLYAKTERQQEAERLLEELAADPRLNESQRVLMLATGQGVLGQTDQGEKLLRDAIANNATDGSLHLALAQSLRNRQQPESLAEAERVLRTAVQQFPESAEAKRRLANLLIELGGEANLKQAQQLVEELALSDAAAQPGDTFVLARLYDREGQWQQAGEALERAAVAHDATPEQLAVYIDRMLLENTPEEAQSHLKRLESRLPNHRGTIRLKVRWLLASQRTSEIPTVIENYEQHLQRNLTGENAAAAIHSIIGELHLLAGDLAQAEARFRQLHETDPTVFQPLLVALARQQRLDEAIELYAQAAATDTSPQPAIELATALTTAKPTPQQLEQANNLFTAALAAQRDDPAPRLLEALATFHLVHHQTDQAIALYRQLLEIEPKNHGALNNLAVALSESEETRAEALTTIDEAIRLSGKRPTYLDTKATILLLEGRNEVAVELLEQAVSGPERRPVHQLHLAVAYARSGQDDQARKTLADAQANGLDDDILTTTDHAMLEELKERWRDEVRQ